MPDRRPHGRPLDRVTLQRAFSSLARHLAGRGVRAHIYVYAAGGAPLVLARRRSRTTPDAAAQAIDPGGSVPESARAVARGQGLPDDWLNDQIRFVPILAPRRATRSEVLFDSESLMVTGASRAHMLAMKARAARARDLEDIKQAARELGITTMAEVREVLGAVYPYDGIPQRAAEKVAECLAELRHERRGRAAPSRAPPKGRL